MNMSLLMVVQPLLDAGKNLVSGTAGKNQGGDASHPFQSLLQGQIASRAPEKPALPADSKETPKQPAASEARDTAAEPGAKEAVKEGETTEAALPGKTEDAARGEEDAAVLAQILAATGMPVVPVEAAPVNGTDGLAEEALLAAAAEASVAGGRKMAADDVDSRATGRPVTEESVEEASDGKVQADAGEEMKNMPATAGAAAPKAAAAGTAAETVKPVAEQLAAQVQQPVPAMAAQPVQQAAVAPMTVEANPAAARVMQQLGTPEWNQAISQRVLWMVGQEQQSASLTLNPPELGPVRVVVSVSNNNASANFFSANPDVRHALEGSLPRLREMMEGAGIQLGQAQVGAENSGNPHSGQASFSGDRRAGAAGDESDIGSLTALADVPSPRQAVSKGLVDTFA